MRRIALAAALSLIAAPALAQMHDPLHGKGSPSAAPAGTYKVEPTHTQVEFTVDHMGISPFTGVFSNASGTLVVDPKHPANAKLMVTIPTDSIHTTSEELTKNLTGSDWFDSKTYPDATFRSTKVTMTGSQTATIDGMLTLHGVTKPITIHAKLFGVAVNPLDKKQSIGFTGQAVIKRSQFGISKYVPLVSDDTVLTIHAAFEKQ